VSRERGDVHPRTRGFYCAKIVIRGRHALGRFAVEQFACHLGHVGKRREQRKAAVADDLRGDALQYFVRKMIQHLPVAMAMDVDEAWREVQARAFNRSGIGGDGLSDRPDRLAIDQQICREGRLP
jgi:hypothetical protein